MSYGGFWKRLFAYIIDWIILLVVTVMISIGMGIFAAGSGIDIEDEQALLVYQAQANLLSFLVAWLYYALMESSARQATFGKSILGMKVTNLQGERIGFGRATVRFFSKILSTLLFFIGFIMIAFTEKKQGLHDLIASTLIVNKNA